MALSKEAAELEERPAPLFGGRRILESIVVTASIPLVGWVIDHRDPFFLAGRFPWLVFAPFLVALRHGSALSLANMVALAVAVVLAWRTRLVPMEEFPAEPLVGLFAMAMIAGQFSDLWTRRNTRLAARGEAQQRRAEALARSHFLLELSHERVDEQLARSTSNLRESIAAVRALAGPDGRVCLATRGDAILEVFAAYCGLEVGELFDVEQGALGPRYAVLGRPEPVDDADPLVLRAIRSKQLVYVPAAARDAGAPPSANLAAVPFVAAGVVRAVLCVQAMPFIAFQRKNLEGMVTLAGHFADLAAGAGPEVERWRKEPSGAREREREREREHGAAAEE